MRPRAAVTRARWEAQASTQDLPQLAKDEVAVAEEDTLAPPIEEKDPMVEDTPAEEGTGSKNEEGQGSAMSQVGLSESEPESPGPQEDEAAPEEPPPPPPLPYTTAADFRVHHREHRQVHGASLLGGRGVLRSSIEAQP